MGKLKLILIGLVGVCSFQATGQQGYYEDALRFSQSNWLIGSTARMQGFAGAQTALGGDLSLAGTNPAGLGFYNRSSAVFTLGLDFQDSDDQFAGLTTPNFNNVLGIQNGGVVLNYNKGRYSEEKFKGGSLGVTYAKINNFNREYRYEGESGTSIVDFFLDQAYINGTGAGSLGEAAYNQFLIDFDDLSENVNFAEIEPGIISSLGDPDNISLSNPEYNTPFGAGLSVPYQQELVTESGSQNQINISWGGNYDDRFYFGAGVGIQSLYYKRTREFTENEFLLPNGELDPWLNSIQLNDEIIARGNGINMNFGAILRPVHNITLGVSYQTPTVINIKEESDYSLSANWGNYLYFDSLNSQEYYDLSTLETYVPEFLVRTNYKVRTPARLNLGAAIFIGKSGFLTADVERVDYGNAELQSDDFSPLLDNQVVATYKSVTNYRVGGEYRLDAIRLRAGVGLNQDPTANDNDQTYTTFGIGYKSADYFFDLAIVNTRYTTSYSPYQISDEFLTILGQENPLVTSEVNNTTVTISAGFSF